MKPSPKSQPESDGPAPGDLVSFDGSALPHSPEAERLLLSCVLADMTGEAWAVALNCGIRPAAFYTAAHTAVWDTLTELRKAGTAGVDAALLAEALKQNGRLDEVGGFAGVMAITEAVPTSASTRFYAETLVLLWERRHAIKMAAELREVALAPGNREEFAAKSSAVGQRLIGLGRKTAQRSMVDQVADTREHTLSIAQGRFDRSRLVRTGLDDFDRKCKPFGLGGADDKLVMVGGGSGHGKSVMLRQVAHTALTDGQRVLAYTREQGAGDFCGLMASAVCGYDLDKAEEQPADATARWAAEVQRMMDEWVEKTLFCYTHSEATPLITVEDLCDHARAWCHLHGPPELIIVDYLQMFDVRPPKRFPNTEGRVGYIAYALQALQRELGCIVLVGVQLNESGLEQARQLKHDEDGRLIHQLPHRGWIRDSQQIYHAADRVIFLYVPPETRDGLSQLTPGLTRLETWIYQEKRRKGATGYTVTTFEKSYVRFVPAGPKGGAPYQPPAGKVPPHPPQGGKLSKDAFLK